MEHFKKVLPSPVMFLCVVMICSCIELVGHLNSAKFNSSCVLIWKGLFSVPKWCRPREYCLVCNAKAEWSNCILQVDLDWLANMKTCGTGMHSVLSTASVSEQLLMLLSVSVPAQSPADRPNLPRLRASGMWGQGRRWATGRLVRCCAQTNSPCWDLGLARLEMVLC